MKHISPDYKLSTAFVEEHINSNINSKNKYVYSVYYIY